MAQDMTLYFDAQGKPYRMVPQYSRGKPTGIAKKYLSPLSAAQEADPRAKQWAAQNGVSIRDGQVTDNSEFRHLSTWDQGKGEWDHNYLDDIYTAGVGGFLGAGALSAFGGAGGAAGAGTASSAMPTATLPQAGAVLGGTTPAAAGAGAGMKFGWDEIMDLALGGMSMFGGGGGGGQDKTKYKGSRTNAEQTLFDFLRAANTSGDALTKSKPAQIRLRSTYKPQPVSIPGLGFQIGGGLGIPSLEEATRPADELSGPASALDELYQASPFNTEGMQNPRPKRTR